MSIILSEFMTQNEISDRKERKARIFVIVSTYRAKAGQEDAIIALHEDWQRKQGLKANVYLSWELLRNIEDPREFTAIVQFESEELARTLPTILNQDAWYFRLASLTEQEPTNATYASEWRAT